ncbi:MAG: PGF-pre-PGF domain-containing protein, partial [Candidatus Methanoperedens sp.]|nr:PGF-pre-PGF domain-containing protein [Candidatus Methanoperedens sp.]
PGKVKMVRWESGKWVQLDTTQGTKDNSFTYYEAKTGGFSVFAIVGLKEGEVVPTATPKPTVVTTPVGEKTPVTEATEKESPGFGAISVISAMVLLAALRMRKRKRR